MNVHCEIGFSVGNLSRLSRNVLLLPVVTTQPWQISTSLNYQRRPQHAEMSFSTITTA